MWIMSLTKYTAVDKTVCPCGKEVDVVINRAEPTKELVSYHLDPEKPGFCRRSMQEHAK
jgi:hypothetical protein